MNDDSMNDDPLDLSALDPARDTARFAAMAGAVARDAMAARARYRAAPSDVFAELAGWSRPALVAAALVLAVALPAVARYGRAASVAPPSTAASASDVLGIPQQLTELLHSSQTPSLAQLHEALTLSAGSSR